MARIRLINPRAPLDEDVASLSIAARLLWAYLPCYCDRDGRFEWRPLWLKAQVLPADAVDMAGLLAELVERRFVVRYEEGGKRYGHVRNWAKYQRPHPHEAKSILPSPACNTADVPPRNDILQPSPDILQPKTGNGCRGLDNVTECHSGSLESRNPGSKILCVSSPDPDLFPDLRADPDQTRTHVANDVPEKAPEPARSEKIPPIEYPPREHPAPEPPPPNPSELPSVLDPATVTGLLHLLKVTVERVRPERGFYNPGPDAHKYARDFLENFHGKAPEAREQIASRLELFVADEAYAPWTAVKFARVFNAIGIPRQSRASPEPDIRFGHARYKPSRDPQGDVKL